MFGLIPELRGSEQRVQPFHLLQLPTLAVFGDVLSHVYRTNRTQGLRRPVLYWVFLVGDTGFEPVTSSVSVIRTVSAVVHSRLDYRVPAVANSTKRGRTSIKGGTERRYKLPWPCFPISQVRHQLTQSSVRPVGLRPTLSKSIELALIVRSCKSAGHFKEKFL